MKRVAGYIGAFIGGMIMMGGTAWAATVYVQAQQSTSQVVLNGQVVGKPTRLIYGGSSYVSLYSIEQALKKAGLDVTWNGSTHPGTFTINTTQSNGGGGSSVVNQSQLPYTYTAKDGYKLTVNSIDATPQATILNVTVSNVGTTTAQSGNMQESSISTGGPSVNYVSQSAALENSDFNLQPGQSVTGDVTYGPMPTGTKQFTLYVLDFDANTHGITFGLNSALSQTTPVATVNGTPKASNIVSFSFSGVPAGYSLTSMTFTDSLSPESVTEDLATAQQNVGNQYAEDVFTANSDASSVGFIFDPLVGGTEGQFLFTFTNTSGQTVTAESPIVQIQN